MLHSSCLLAFLHWWGQAELGVLDRPTDAISVEIVESRVLEAMLEKNKPEPAPAVAATAPVAGNAEADVKAAELKEAPKVVEKPPDKVPDAVPDPVPKAEPDPPLDAPPDLDTRVVNAEPPEKPPAEPVPVQGPGEKKETPVADESTVAARKDPEPPPTPEPEEKPPTAQPKPDPKPRTEEPQPKAKPEKDQREQPRKATRAGGITARARSGEGTGAPRASASSGAVLGYAAAVRARVAGNKPSGAGQRGTAVVSFGVAPSGGLSFASIARSSGNASLDRLAVSAVRASAPFPNPPPGATPAQLRFSIPFHFQ
jgi:protein TonB